MSTDKAGEAREGLLDNVAGKAKEVVGAVSGKDDLVEEGQLQQAEASNRKAAVAAEAVAEAKREEAAQALRETSPEAAEARGGGRGRAEPAAAAREAEQREAAEREAAERRADELAESRLREADAIAAD